MPVTPSQNDARRPSPPRIDVLGEEHHEFPANRPGPTARTPNPNARTKDEPAHEPKGSLQDRLDASRAAQRASANSANPTGRHFPGGASDTAKIGDSQRKILDQLPEGHPMRERLLSSVNQAKKAPMFSTRRRSRLEIERAKKGSGPEQEIAARSMAEVDPNYQAIGLPSEFRIYDFKQLTVRHLKGVHQAKLSRAAKERKMRYVVEAISSTLGEGISAFDLSPQDFYFLLYWHRLQSFPKNPQMIPYTCTNVDHIRRTLLREGNPERLEPETLDISTIMNETTLKTDYLKELDLTPFVALDEKYQLGFETMRDIVEFAELKEEEAYYAEEVGDDDFPNQQDDDFGEAVTTATVSPDVPSEEDFTEVEWLQERAVYLKRAPGRNTILERNEIVKEMSSDEIMELDKYIELITNYGVSESTTIKCKDCGASHRVKLSVDALTFLP